MAPTDTVAMTWHTDTVTMTWQVLGDGGPLTMAVVQTAYANGASGRYIRSLGVPVRLANTGVKYVHHVAYVVDEHRICG